MSYWANDFMCAHYNDNRNGVKLRYSVSILLIVKKVADKYIKIV